MLAVDTNVLVRFLTADHPRQFERARALIEANEISIALTVMLETEWVLRDSYGLSRDQIADALNGLLRLPSVHAEDETRLRRALDWTGSGLDFADALHLSGAGGCEAFVTFDRDLLRAGKRLELAVQTP